MCCLMVHLFFCVQTGWSIPVEMVIGPDLGISYMSHRNADVSTANFCLDLQKFHDKICSMLEVCSQCGWQSLSG
jgi:hypothetical protein